ncbi:hypothetical protein D3C86_1790380 [compost metagenome]
MQNMQLPAIFFAQGAEHLDGIAHVLLLIEPCARRRVVRGVEFRWRTAVKAELTADMAIALRNERIHGGK